MDSIKIIRAPEVIARCGFNSRQHLHVTVKRGQFPKPIKTGERSVGWLESEIAAWIDSRVTIRDQKPEELAAAVLGQNEKAGTWRNRGGYGDANNNTVLANAYYDSARDLRWHLAGEFGRRQGWTIVPGDAFNLPDLLERTSHRPGWIEGDHELQDHCYFYRDSAGVAVGIASHLYGVTPDKRARIEAKAAKRGLKVTWPDFPSWWLPGKSRLLAITRAEDTADG